jgi:hypothetical protein
MKVAELQSFLRQIVPFTQAAGASAKVTEDLDRVGEGLEPFKEQSLGEFADFLRMADEYVRNGTLPASAKSSRRRSSSNGEPQTPKLSLEAAAQTFMSLYEQGADPALDDEVIDAEISKFYDLSISQLKSLGEQVDHPVPTNLRKKPEIIALFKRMIKEHRESPERGGSPEREEERMPDMTPVAADA